MAEVMVSVLLLSVAVSAVAGSMLTGNGQSANLQVKEQALLSVDQLLQSLGNYVSADTSDATKSFAPGGCWNLKDPTKPADCPAGWALDETASHDATFLLPSAVRSAPYLGKLGYTVAVDPTTGLRTVSAQMAWMGVQP
jgi:hypothetical protein